MNAVKSSVSAHFTEGKIFKKLLLFVLPILATNLLQTFYHAADMMVASLSSERNAVGAIGTTGAFLSMILNIFIGFSVGANVIVARKIGAKDSDGVQKAVHTALLMAVLFGLLGAVIGIVFARPILTAMGNTGSLLELAIRYSYIYLLGVPFASLTNFLCAIFRAKGNAKLPLIVLSSTGIVNVVFNLFFVLVCGLSVEGVAAATAIANLLSVVVLLTKLCQQQDETAFSFRRLKMDKTAFKQILYVGIPAGIQGALFSIANMLIQSSIVSVNYSIVPSGSDYQPVVNGNAAAGNLDGFVYTSINSVSQGVITFTSQNIGAGKPKRVKPIIYKSFLITLIIGLTMSFSLIAFRRPLLSLYGVVEGVEGSLERIAFETANTRFWWIGAPYFLCGLMDNCSGALRGMGKSITSTIVSLIGACLFRVVWLLTVFPAFPVLEVIYLSYPISWLLTSTIDFVIIQVLLKKLIKANA